MISRPLNLGHCGLQYQKMTKFFITGVSSGIGRALTEELVKAGHSVWGVSRRRALLIGLKKQLNANKNFKFCSMDITSPSSWQRLITKMSSAKFVPQVVVFNAAILENDYLSNNSIDMISTRKMMETNYFSTLSGLNELSKVVRRKTKFIFVGSSSAFKGSGEEGIGYSGSKAALNTAFESLFQKFNAAYNFKIIHFGPIKTDMVPFDSRILFMRSPQQAARAIIEAVKTDGHIFYYPWLPFFFLRIIKLLPSPIYLSVLNTINSIHRKYRK